MLFQLQVNIAETDVRGDQVQVINPGRHNGLADRRLALHQLARLGHTGVAVTGVTEIPADRSLGVQVPEQGGNSGLRSQGGNVGGSGCFTDTTLEIMKRNDLH